MSQEKLGELLNVQKSAISKYERGTVEPNRSTLIKMSELFDCSIDYLVGYSYERNGNELINSLSVDNELIYFSMKLIEREPLHLLFKELEPMGDSDILKILNAVKAIKGYEDKKDGI